MITCRFEESIPSGGWPGHKGNKALLRHVVTHAIVEKDECLLMVKRAAWLLEPNKWAFPGGFLDRDETTQEGVLRELREESGWEGEIVSLFRINSNPQRPNDAERQNVVLEYIVRPVKQIQEPDKESTSVLWIPIKKLPPREKIAFDQSNTVELYKQYRNSPFPLPILA